MMTIFATHDTYVFDDRNITKISENLIFLNINFFRKRKFNRTPNK